VFREVLSDSVTLVVTSSPDVVVSVVFEADSVFASEASTIV
jgi:hypothetical protein